MQPYRVLALVVWRPDVGGTYPCAICFLWSSGSATGLGFLGGPDFAMQLKHNLAVVLSVVPLKFADENEDRGSTYGIGQVDRAQSTRLKVRGGPRAICYNERAEER